VSTVSPRTSSARNEVRAVAPKLIDLSEQVLYWPTAMTAGRIARQVFEETKR
jgi:hypothetical protein